MRYRYLDDFRRGISVFAIISYGIAVLGTPQCPPRLGIPIDRVPTSKSYVFCIGMNSFYPTFDSFLVPSFWKDYFLETKVLCK